LIALPGGMPGAQHLHDSPDLTALLRAHIAADGLVAAICAAPVVVLSRHGLVGERRATAHPSVFAELPASQRCADPVVVDRGLVTGRGAGTAVAFALALVEQLYGAERRDEVARAMCV
jgi:4-methyl-5(b-hydroxyethyl)-thiazole monophosphate biosynthesis